MAPVARSTIRVEAPMYTPIDSTEPSRTMTPSATSERAPRKHVSSTLTGPPCNGSSTPPMPAPPEMWQFLPICAQEPTVAQVSTMAPLSTYAPRLTKDGISTTPGAMNAERRTTQPGTARNPDLRKRAAFHPLNLESTLSHQAVFPGPPGITLISLIRNERSTAFFSHWLTRQRPSA